MYNRIIQIYRITGLPILHLYPEQKTFTNYYALFPLQNEQFRPWEVCSLDDLWFFAASTPSCIL